MKALQNLFPGKKTHTLVISALGVIWFTYLGGNMDLVDAVRQTLEVLTISTLRFGVAAAQQGKQ